MQKLTTIAAVRTALLEKISGSLLDNSDAIKLKFKPYLAADTNQLDVPTAAAGFLIPYFDLDGQPTTFWRYRYLEDTRKGFAATGHKKPLRYVQAKGGVNEVYLAPYVDWRRLAEDANVPLVITEGELKAACVTKLQIPTIGLGGVFCFKSTKNREALLPSLREFIWQDRTVIICYDSDAITNNMVVMAENQLAAALTAEGALVKIARLPAGPDGAKQGVDDYLLVNPVDHLMELLNDAGDFKQSRALHEMNEYVAYIRNPGFVYDHVNKMRLGCRDFTQHAYSNYNYVESVIRANGSIGSVVHQTATDWMQWGGRTELDACTFSPGKPEVYERKLNMWTGWGADPDKGDVRPWAALLDHIFVDADPGARKWFEQWCAYPLQNPGVKMATATVFWGIDQGSGKTIVGHTLMKIYGKHGSEITDTEIEDDRCDWAENMQFVLADDITASNSRKLANRLKTLITQKTLKINQKYIPRYHVPDCINYYFTSNDPDAFVLDDGDRRYFIHEVRSGKLPVELRNKFIQWRDSPKGVAALFHYLLTLDTSDFDPQAEAMHTSAKDAMVHVTKSDLGSWVRDVKDNVIKLKQHGELFTSAELLAEYDTAGSGRVTSIGMARELKRAGFRMPGKGGMVHTKLGNVRLYAMYNRNKWKDATSTDIAKHYESNREMIKKTKF